MKRLIHQESGSAMTEFVVGLPIFLLIFTGVQTLQHLNAAGLEVQAEAERAVWRDVVHIQAEKFAEPRRLSPVATTVTDVFGGEGSMAVANVSLWADSGFKALVPTSVLDGTVDAHLTLADVMGDDAFYSHTLMNDLAEYESGSIGGGWAGIFGAVLSGSGARPALAAGYRYGDVAGESTREFESSWGDVTMSARYRVPAPTHPTHRFFAVALTRAELANDVRYDEAIPEFNNEIKTATGVDSFADGSECAGAVAEWGLCIEATPSCNDGNGNMTADCPCGESPRCSEEVLNPLQSIFDQACGDAEGATGCN